MIALALLLATWAAALLPGSASAAPQGAAPAAAGGIAWRDCGRSLECARVRVPLDWSRPRAGTITLAVMRYLAGRPGRRIKSVFFNPGGPARPASTRSGRNGELLDGAVRGRFDIVSWDPRGVGASTSVRCFANARDETRFWGDLTVPSTRPASERYARLDRAQGRHPGVVERSAAAASRLWSGGGEGPLRSPCGFQFSRNADRNTPPLALPRGRRP